MERCPWQDQSLLFPSRLRPLSLEPRLPRSCGEHLTRGGGWAGQAPLAQARLWLLPLATFSPNPPARPIASLEILLRIFPSPLRANLLFFFPLSLSFVILLAFAGCRPDQSANPLRPGKETRERAGWRSGRTKLHREVGEGARRLPSSSAAMSVLSWKPFVYGGLASLVAEFGTFPVDLTKTRLQVQGQSIDSRFREIKYRGMFHALFRISREEGILALYSGIAPALLRQASYGTIKIGIYQSLKRLFVHRLEDETLLINVICGVISGVISSALANPTDVLKIRMQAQGSLFQGGMIGSFIDIYQQEGTRGLWRGVVPTAQRAAIVVGVELPVYDITKKHLILSGVMGDTILTHFISSFTCGLAGAVASNPVDVVRTRMMNQRAIVGTVELYRGTMDGLLKTWKSEGFFALYKGFWPNWLRLGPWNIIFFITYEQLKRLPF
ncbi:brain mitochondrial carrier protein 1 [Pantherophis guttatus]|uniref:Brain mitochondrial carrier protein 1 n=1 Tax=Pantherophis guttatus TaxID=94885 RepID=A0ABM3ZIB4_PANGU|nr:brain mitochondrial carrier protein 1 [Pantherophis guttatus]